jgi:hypothetical protein
VTAAGLADVGAADPHPAVVAGRLDQGPQQFAVGTLGRGPRGEGGTGVADALGQRVAQALELAEVEQSRCRNRRRDRMGDGDAAEAVEGEASQLVLEAADLAAQLGTREALVGRRKAFVAVDAKRRSDALSCQYLGHLPSQV